MLGKKFKSNSRKILIGDALTESQCKALHFRKWQFKEDFEKEISLLQSELDAGCITEEEFNKKVANEKNTPDIVISVFFAPSIIAPALLTAYDVWEPVSYTEPPK